MRGLGDLLGKWLKRERVEEMFGGCSGSKFSKDKVRGRGVRKGRGKDLR